MQMKIHPSPRRPLTEEEKKGRIAARPRYNSYKGMTKEEKEERIRHNKYRREDRQREREEKARAKVKKLNVKRELVLLQYMEKSDVLYYHHEGSESLRKEIRENIEFLKIHQEFEQYHPYVWNRLGEGNNHLPLSQFGRLWHGGEFETIYDVPLDGSYVFYTTDSGQRGLGSSHYMTVRKAEEEAHVRKVNPGIPGITY